MAMTAMMEMVEIGMETMEMEETTEMESKIRRSRGTKGVVDLTRWFLKMETVFHISNCPEVYQV
ncbi:hypothetical protein Tco_1298803, partial [Tanacetum coccineum]